MIYRQTSYVIILLLIHFQIWGQSEANLTLNDITSESNHILDYSDKLSLKIFGITKSNSIRHFDNVTKRFVEYRPNENFNLGIGVGYKWLNLDLAISVPGTNDDNDIFGNTDRFDIQANMYLRNFTIDINYQMYKGYYGFNAKQYILDFDPRNPKYPIRPDMRTLNMASNVLYNFKPENFSYRAAFVYNERQLKSAGSWLLGSSLGYFKMDADSTIVPIQLRQVFNPQIDFRNVKYINFSLGGGYGHTFVIKKKYFISLTLVVGFGPTFKLIPEKTGVPSKTEADLAIRAIGRMALGFNGDKTFWGISSITSDSSEIDENTSYLSRSVFHVKIFFGIRLNAPRILTAQKDK